MRVEAFSGSFSSVISFVSTWHSSFYFQHKSCKHPRTVSLISACTSLNWTMKLHMFGTVMPLLLIRYWKHCWEGVLRIRLRKCCCWGMFLSVFQQLLLVYRWQLIDLRNCETKAAPFATIPELSSKSDSGEKGLPGKPTFLVSCAMFRIFIRHQASRLCHASKGSTDCSNVGSPHIILLLQ